MSFDLMEFSQALGERYERLIKDKEKVVLYYDFIPYQQFSITIDLVLQEMQYHFDASLEAVKKEMVSTVESFWVKKYNCIINRFYLWENKLFVELPKSHFLWISEVDNLMGDQNCAMC